MTVYKRCQRPGCGKKKTIPKRVPSSGTKKKRVAPGGYVDRAIYESDPYRSTECCKIDHGLKDRPVGERMRGPRT